MSSGDWVPQLLYLMFIIVGLVSAGYQKGVNGFFGTLFGSSVVLAMLIWGGFFDALIAVFLGG